MTDTIVLQNDELLIEQIETKDGFHLFVLGPTGSGRHKLVRHFIESLPPQPSRTADWCYVHHFAEPDRPRAIELPPGRGVRLAGQRARHRWQWCHRW